MDKLKEKARDSIGRN